MATHTSLIRRLLRVSIYFANLFEHYDTALYSFLTPLFAKLFFPQNDAVTALILTFAITPLGMLARPIGALFFGFIGDAYGRDRALLLSLFGMTIATVGMGFLPSAEAIGFLAPCLLLSIRIFQNFFGAGEVTGGAICYLESLDGEKEKDLGSSIYSTSTVAGILVASGFVALFYHYEWIETHWRWLYFLSLFTAIWGLFVRALSAKLEKTPLSSTPRINLQEKFAAIRRYWLSTWTIGVAAGFSYATNLLAFSFMNAFVPLISPMSTSDITKINTLLLLLDILLLPLFGMIAARYDRVRMMKLSTLLSVLLGIPLFALLDDVGLPLLLCIRFVFVCLGVWFYAGFYSWAQQLIPKEHRYTIISFAYSTGSQLFGGVTATLSLWFYHQTGWASSAGWYWIFLGLLMLFSLKLQETYSTRVRRVSD